MNKEPSRCASPEEQSQETPPLVAAVPCVTEIIITCSPQILHGMVAAYETAIEQAAGELPLLILRWGRSQKYKRGTIVLEWLGKVPVSFLDSLDIDEEVLDYSFYEDERMSIDSEQEPVLPAQIDQETGHFTNALPSTLD